jgi:hypothetical protein
MLASFAHAVKVNDVRDILEASRIVLKGRKYLAILLIAAFFIAALAVYLPIALTPGNTLDLMLVLLGLDGALLILVFSILFGLLTAMHVYAGDTRRRIGARETLGETVGGVASLAGALIAKPLCPYCLTAILSIFGLGVSGGVFLLTHRNEILLASLVFLGISLHFASKKVVRVSQKGV